MVNHISNNIPQQSAINTTDKRAERSEPASSEAQQTSQKQARADRTPLEISPQAKLLSQLEAQTREQPDIDEARLETLREQLDQGSYEIDNLSLARKIIDFEL